MSWFSRARPPIGKPLADMIGIVLHNTTYQELLRRLEGRESIDDLTPVANSQDARSHREKILREEVSKQFSHEYRPIVDLILNSVDA